MIIDINSYKENRKVRLQNKYSELYSLLDRNKSGVLAVINYCESDVKLNSQTKSIKKLISDMFDYDTYIKDAINENRGFGDSNLYYNLGGVLGDISDIVYNKDIRLRYLNLLDDIERLSSCIFFFLNCNLYHVGR